MKKFGLLLLDANIVIEFSRQGLWQQIIARCDIHLARTVVDEAQFYPDANGDPQPIDLTPHINSKSITIFDLKPSDLAGLRARFDPSYFEKLDPGETESLAYLLQQGAEVKICSADKIVYRVLGNMHLSDQGISLEEILNQVGLGRKLDRKFSSEYRKQWTQKGFQDGLGGIGVRGKS